PAAQAVGEVAVGVGPLVVEVDRQAGGVGALRNAGGRRVGPLDVAGEDAAGRRRGERDGGRATVGGVRRRAVADLDLARGGRRGAVGAVGDRLHGVSAVLVLRGVDPAAQAVRQVAVGVGPLVVQ